MLVPKKNNVVSTTIVSTDISVIIQFMSKTYYIK